GEMPPASFVGRLRDEHESLEPSSTKVAPAGGQQTEPRVADAVTADAPSGPYMSGTSGTDPASDAQSGSTSQRLQDGSLIGYFGDYELEKVLGEGGMGIVYKARQLSLNRPVALKMIKAARFASADEVRRFQNESEAVARLDHPNIVPIFEIGQY